MSRLWNWAAWAVPLLLACLLVQRLVLDSRLPRSCDTTYLWEGYDEVPFGAGGQPYRLISFKDGDTAHQAAHDILQRRHVVPVLFIHGHMGTHQQMRSAASETGRELARRLAANASWPLWLQWYAADFNAEPSALDARLLARQAKFVAQCIQHLRKVHGGTAAANPQPFRLVVVAYSMGGVVARDVLRQLAADPTFDLGELVALVTLGSPHSFPQYMPHTPLPTLLSKLITFSSNNSNATTAAAAAAAAATAAAAAAVPRVNIAAGAGDHSLPQTHVGASVPADPAAGSELCLMMGDMPAVWTTSSHKGIVSCNQLVRQLVPLLVDATLLSVDRQHHSAPQRQAAVQQLLQQRLATNVAQALGLVGLPAVAESVAAAEAAGQEQPQAQLCPSDMGAEAALQQPAQQTSATLIQHEVLPGHMLRLAWDVAELRAAGKQGLLLLLTTAPPCSHWAMAAVQAGGSSRQLAVTAAAPLPPLLPGLQQSWAPRHWYDIMQGVDWLHNATRLLYVPFTGQAGGQQPLAAINLAVLGSRTGPTTVLAQALHSPPGQQQLVLPTPGTAAALPTGHPAVLSLQLPQQLWPLSGSRNACSGGSISFRCLAVLLLGSTPPWNLHIQAKDNCSTSTSSESGSNSTTESSSSHKRQVQRLMPAVVGMQTGKAAADSMHIVAGGAPVALWNGVAPLDGLMLISDPRCAYSLRLEWDLGGWLGLGLRHLLYILPTVCMAVSMARLSPLRGSMARVAVVAAAMAAWGSLHPDVLQAATGLRPWVQLSTVEGLAAFVLAYGVSGLQRSLLMAGLRLLRQTLPIKPSHHAELLSRLCILATIASSLLHPALPAYLGCTCLAVRLAALMPKQLPAGRPAGSRGGDRSPAAARAAAWQPWALGWLAFLTQLLLLPAVDLYSWLVGGMRPPEAIWTDGRMLIAVLALHACLLRCSGSTNSSSRQQSWQLLLATAMHEAAACTATVCSLWGHPYITLHAACVSVAADVLLRGYDVIAR